MKLPKEIRIANKASVERFIGMVICNTENEMKFLTDGLNLLDRQKRNIHLFDGMSCAQITEEFIDQVRRLDFNDLVFAFSVLELDDFTKESIPDSPKYITANNIIISIIALSVVGCLFILF